MLAASDWIVHDQDAGEILAFAWAENPDKTEPAQRDTNVKQWEVISSGK